MITATQGRAEGDARMLAGIALASLRKEHRIKSAQVAMIQAGLGREDRLCSSDDMAADLAEEYSDGGKWIGAAVHSLALARIVDRVGNVKSSRPSRHATEVKVWRIRDDFKARLFVQALTLWLNRNPLPPDDPSELFSPITATKNPVATTTGH
jgi:hypothetical protein